ncbi:hypothetical protein ADICEAN_00136 [Cesiribacter andamanensis AMV16]|uniref:Uncharacterized protein n=2 Tax=Cesiribacter TaxID=1133570 RepID=M7P294_9BACT|nr:hypothetical protein ADICEAN_00136 [Cesiribacter andamanensis AMV16]
MGWSKKQTTSLLTANHQLLQEHEDTILQDPYLYSCRLGLQCSMGFIGSLNLRLGHLLKIWKQIPQNKGRAIRLLETRISTFSSDNSSHWYDIEANAVQAGYLIFYRNNSIPLKRYLLDLAKSPAQEVFVSLSQVIEQISNSECCDYSKQLRYAHEQFLAGLENIQPSLSQDQRVNVDAHSTIAGGIHLQVKIPSMSKKVVSLGLIDHKATYYREEVDTLIQEIALDTGFAFMKKDVRENTFVFCRTFSAYDIAEWYAPSTLRSISALFLRYQAGMEKINTEIH